VSDLETRLETARREITDAFNERLGLLDDASSSQVKAARKDLTERLDKQAVEQSAQLRAAQQSSVLKKGH
jgi:hypothetical protein